MSQTLTRLLVHLVFSTKHRVPTITSEIEVELFAYVGGICREHESPLIAAGAAADHVHLLVVQSKNKTLSDLLMHIKKDSSRWIKTKGASFRKFRWQDGYSGFSIGQSQVGTLERYFARQRERHRRVSYQEELLSLLKKYRVEYDARYIWE